MESATIMTAEEAEAFGYEWAIVEVFGHRRHAGLAREEERFGVKLLRIDIPKYQWVQPEGQPAELEVVSYTTHFYGGASIFSYSLTDEATARKINTLYLSPPHRLLSTQEPAAEAGFDDDRFHPDPEEE